MSDFPTFRRPYDLGSDFALIVSAIVTKSYDGTLKGRKLNNRVYFEASPKYMCFTYSEFTTMKTHFLTNAVNEFNITLPFDNVGIAFVARYNYLSGAETPFRVKHPNINAWDVTVDLMITES